MLLPFPQEPIVFSDVLIAQPDYLFIKMFLKNPKMGHSK